ncbi:hypothetical protein GCM10018781_62120 [Kitasatospora indigofera]|uniref:Uncharacterized protein n=1 Tax=Kitasatospora indigofera TaxID=67307 RepID=A0A919L1V0_9ACTN|nr:hypothetical protein GCM10018781_62120 [Kitasatospora indigofera]
MKQAEREVVAWAGEATTTPAVRATRLRAARERAERVTRDMRETPSVDRGSVERPATAGAMSCRAGGREPGGGGPARAQL